MSMRNRSMTQALPFRKIFDGVATHEQMFELFNRVPDCPCEDRISGKAFENSWFEIESTSYEYMLEMLPPLFMRAGMFAMSELKAGFVGSVFFMIEIDEHRRWFTGYCNLGNRHSPDAMRAAIIEHETTGTAGLSRDAKLDLIWARTPNRPIGAQREGGGNRASVDGIGRLESTMSDYDTRALLAEALEFLNDHPRFSLRRDRRRNSYSLARRIEAYLSPWETLPHRAIAVARDRWSSSGVLRIDADERMVAREADGYWVRGWVRIAFSSVGEIDEKLSARYRKALDSLPGTTRAILLARQRDQRSYGEIAHQFGLTIADVEGAIADALFQIGRALDQE